MQDDPRVQTLNRGCQCITTDAEALAAQLDGQLPDAAALLRDGMPNVFSSGPVFIGAEQVSSIVDTIRAIESVGCNEAYREAVLADAPPSARVSTPAKGVLFGYDFHLAAEGPKLIEINTNAGGVLLNLALARAQVACCPEVQPLMRTALDEGAVEASIVNMFREEAKVAGHPELRRVAIVDEDPPSQFLYPEMLLFAALLERNGIDARVVGPEELQSDGGLITHLGDPVELIYNRLTDFYLESDSVAAVRDAWETGKTVVTPHPAAYAVLADKRNLEVLSDPERLREFGVAQGELDLLAAAVPATRRVDPQDAEALWADRKQLFFKPATGFGSRATYAGKKITRKVFANVLHGEYVAQQLIAPSERVVNVDGAPTTMKVDIRAYTYGGEVLLFAARVYRGQVTNFRTPGSGFAPLFVLPALA
ncbi:MAG: hypothetical protein ACRBN8_39290 [Nannocystales bacterium]